MAASFRTLGRMFVSDLESEIQYHRNEPNAALRTLKIAGGWLTRFIAIIFGLCGLGWLLMGLIMFGAWIWERLFPPKKS